MRNNLAGLRAPLLWRESRFVALAIISFATSLSWTAIFPVLPIYARSLGAGPVELGLLTGSFLVLQAAAQLGGAILPRSVTSSLLIRVGLAVDAIATGLMAVTGQFALLLFLRSFAGAGAGLNRLGVRVYIAESAPRRVATVTGAVAAAAATGEVLGPLIGGAVAAVFGMGAPFLAVALFGVAALMLTSRLPHSEDAAPSPPVGRRPGLGLDNSVLVLLAANVLALAAFGAYYTVAAPLATEVLGWSPVQIGAVISVWGLAPIFVGPILGTMADRFGSRVIAILSCAAMALFGITLASVSDIVAVFVSAFLTGVGIAGFGPAWSALLAGASSSFGRTRTFGVVGAVSTLGTAGGAVAATVAWQAVGLQASVLVGPVCFALAAVALGAGTRGQPVEAGGATA